MLRRGFTLIELSIVLALIAVVLSGGLVLTTAYIQKRQLDATLATMDAIESAILNFSLAYNRIPCPGDITLSPSSAYYGMEAGAGSGSTISTGTGVCTGTGMLPQANFVYSPTPPLTGGQTEGAVPTRTLQLPDNYMFDGWGRRLRYAVDPTMTITNALPVPTGGVSCPATSPITVYDATGNKRSASAAYILLSHGTNGHGAYTNSGSIVNANSANTDEQTNCHCNSSGTAGTYTPSYVEKAITVDSTNGLNNFDDIVSFKEPWQLQTPNNPLASATNSCSYLAVTNITNAPYLTLFNFKENALTRLQNLSLPTGSGYMTDFSIDNQYLAWAGIAGANYKEGWLYSVSSLGLSNPYIYFDPSHSALVSDRLNDVKFSPDGNYFVSGGQSQSPYMQINIKGNTVPYWTTQGTFLTTPIVQYWNFAWSPDSATLYAAENNGGAPNALHYVDVFSHSVFPTRFDIIAAEKINVQSYGGSAAANSGTAQGLAVDPTGTYLAMGVYKASNNGGNYYHPIVIANPPTATSAGTPAQITSGLVNYGSTEKSNDVAWSPDGNYIAVALTNYSKGFDVYKFTPLASPIFTEATISGANCGPGKVVAFSKDSTYLAVGNSSGGAIPLCIYSRSIVGGVTTFTNLNVLNSPPNYISLPAGTIYGISWSK